MKKNSLQLLRIFGIIIVFVIWFFLGMNRIKLTDFISNSFPTIPFITILDTGIVSLLFIFLNAIIIWLSFSSISTLKKTVMIHSLIYVIVVLLTLIYKFFETTFLFNLSENLLRFYFSPLVPLLFIMLFHISKKLENQ
ncbi:hypothetical protein ACE193_19475 [Bernardetia sp. OM2101]|uniref:hypothetical protein n=1 Tax=Bernardetia sp. OM2101 TaxID=3344876 RepID=UPI0035CF7C33